MWVGASEEIRTHQAHPKDSSGDRVDSTPHDARARKRASLKTKTEEIAMYKLTTTVLDLPSDMLELGLIAFASPEFAERFVESLLADTAARTPHEDETGPNPMIAA
jgi:hypothetical protein